MEVFDIEGELLLHGSTAPLDAGLSFQFTLHGERLVILHLHAKAKEVVAREIPLARVTEQGLFDKLTKMKYDIPNNKLDMFDDYIAEIDEKLGVLLG